MKKNITNQFSIYYLSSLSGLKKFLFKKKNEKNENI